MAPSGKLLRRNIRPQSLLAKSLLVHPESVTVITANFCDSITFKQATISMLCLVLNATLISCCMEEDAMAMQASSSRAVLPAC